MTRGSRIVDVRNVVQNVEQFYIALNGVANSVAEGYVADAGVIRQFWPPTVQDEGSIVLDTEDEYSYATVKQGEGFPKALCNYDARTGRWILSDADQIKYVPCLAPPPRSAGQYLVRFTIVSGDLTTQFTDDTWHDVFELGNLGIFENYLLNSNTVQSFIEGEAQISVAEDDGAGAPVFGTIVTKTVYFKAEIVGDNLSFTTAPWTLSSVRWNEYAAVAILTVPSGFGDANEAFITGNTWQDIPPFDDNYKEVIREIYAVEWGPQFTVQVDVLAGSVSGSPTGVPLTTSVRQLWEVTAPNPLDDNTALVNVTISDGVVSVTKQVSMRAAQISEQTDPGSDIDPDFTRYDLIRDSTGVLGPVPYLTIITLSIFPNGQINAEGYADGQRPNFPQKWNELAPNVPDPQNFECRLTVDGDPVTFGSSPVGQWLNLSSVYAWSYTVEADYIPPGVVEQQVGDWTLEVREIGRPDTVKTKLLRALASCIGVNDGGTPP